MILDELRACAGLVAIGAHTRNHPSLAMLPFEQQRAELERSKADLEAWLRAPVPACAYPFGIPDADVNAASRAAARGLFERAYLNVSEHAQDDPLMLPRHTVPDVGATEFARWLRRQAGAPCRGSGG